MRVPARSTACLLFAALLAAGCGSRLNVEQTVELAPGEIKIFMIDPISRDQQVNVRVEATGAPVSVYCCLGKDKDAVEQSLTAEKTPAGSLASQEDAQQAELSMTVPANQDGVVFLTPGKMRKAATAKVKITGG